MGNYAPEKCYITGEITTPIIDSIDSIDYSITYNGNNYAFHFSSNIDWKEFEPNLYLLQALLYNAQWPIDQKTYITPDLLRNIIHSNEYPKDFTQKINYFLLYLYNNYGKEYKIFTDDKSHFIAFARDEEEYSRIKKALFQRNLIKSANSVHNTSTKSTERGLIPKIELTEAGREFSKTLSPLGIENIPAYFDPTKKTPSLCLITGGAEEEKRFADKILDVAAKYGMPTVRSDVNDKNGEVLAHNLSSDIRAKKFDFILLIPSWKSNSNNFIGELYTIAIEHYESEKILILKIDDSPIEARPRLQFFKRFDIRLAFERSRLFWTIATNWNQQPGNRKPASPTLTYFTSNTQEASPKTLEPKEEEATISINSTYELKNRKINIVDRHIERALGVDDIAEEVTDILLSMQNEKGMMFGIFGKWGRGKTYLWEVIKEHLTVRHNNSFHIVEFQSWKYQDTPASWAYLYETLVGTYLNKPNKCLNIWGWIIYFKKLLILNIKRKGWDPILRLFCILTISMFSISYIPPLIENYLFRKLSVLGLLIASSAIISKGILKPLSLKAKELIKEYTGKYNSNIHLGLQAEIEKEIICLAKTWIPNKQVGKSILLFIDDIDRCNEEKVVSLIDSIRVMLDAGEVSDRIKVVAAIDEEILKAALTKKYIFTFNSKVGNLSSIREYIDKLFLCGIRLGTLSNEGKKEFFRNLAYKDFIKNTDLQAEINIQANTESYVREASIHENDYILPYISKDPPSQKNYISPNENTIPKSQIQEGISNKEEYDMLETALLSYPDVTPRKIRIFYYRYLLAKNLLKRKLDNSSLLNYWEKECNQLVLPELIIYSSTKSLYELNEEIINDNSDFHSIKFSIGNKSFQIQQPFFGILYEVVEMVVSY